MNLPFIDRRIILFRIATKINKAAQHMGYVWAPATARFLLNGERVPFRQLSNKVPLAN